MPEKATYKRIHRRTRVVYQDGWQTKLDDDTRDCWQRIAHARNGLRTVSLRCTPIPPITFCADSSQLIYPWSLDREEGKHWHFVPLLPASHRYQRTRDFRYLHQLLTSREHYSTTSNLLLHPERYYKYDWLSDAGAQVRLVEFCTEPVSTQIQVRLTTHDIRSLPCYIAISYEWGTSKASRLILVDGRAMLVGKNCYRVLRQVQRQGASVYYWIDAICIDQWNNAEKSKQVQLMGMVYRNAQSTAVCIGEHDASSALLYGHVKETVEPESPIPASVDSTMSAAENVCARSYFRRLWIVQEILLSKEIYLYCGYDVLAWNTLQKLTVDYGEDNEFVTRGKCSSYVKLALARRQGILTKNWSLVELVDCFAAQECSDTRDKIYGMLGLLPVAKDSASALRLTPDYDLPEVGVALQVIRLYQKIVPSDTFIRACRDVVKVLGVVYHDSAVQALLERSKNELQAAIVGILEDLRQHTWDMSPAAHQKFVCLVEKWFTICRVGGRPHSHAIDSQEDLRHALVISKPAVSATATVLSRRAPRFVDLIPDNIDTMSARYQLSNMYRLVFRCPITKIESQLASESPASHDAMVCTCLQDCLNIARREGVNGPDICLYVDAEDVVAHIMMSAEARRQASADRTKLASNACGLQSGEKTPQSNNRDP